MRMLQPVVWSKGTFLTPQHLQAQDRFIESVLQFRIEALTFRPWGFSSLQIDQEKLAGGTIAIHRAAGLFADGLPFDIPTADAAPPARQVGEFFGPEQKTLEISLGIPDYRVSGINLSAPERSLDTRYIAGVDMVRDENTGISEKPIQLARKNFRLLMEGEPHRGCAVLPCARVSRTETGAIQLDPSFVPPLLDFAVSDLLVSIARRLIELLTARSAQLSGMRRQ